MRLIPCAGCGFFRVEGKPCATCAQGKKATFDDVVEQLKGAGVPYTVHDFQPHVDEFHALVVESSNLTHRPNGGYVHIGRTRCTKCGERFYYVVNAITPLTEAQRADVDNVMSSGFGVMVAAAPPCRGSSNVASS
jgi:hypothetical protein